MSAWKRRRRQLRWFWQRGRRGYSDQDVWNFDTYIAGIIGRGVRDLRECGHGHPDDIMTEEEWHSILDRISGPLLTYSDGDKWRDGYTYEEEMRRYDAAREAMHLFAEHLGGMWD